MLTPHRLCALSVASLSDSRRTPNVRICTAAVPELTQRGR